MFRIFSSNFQIKEQRYSTFEVLSLSLIFNKSRTQFLNAAGLAFHFTLYCYDFVNFSNIFTFIQISSLLNYCSLLTYTVLHPLFFILIGYFSDIKVSLKNRSQKLLSSKLKKTLKFRGLPKNLVYL